MNYREMIAKLKEGYRTRRHSWSTGSFLVMTPPSSLVVEGVKYSLSGRLLCYYPDRDILDDWECSIEPDSTFAHDWYTIPKVSPFTYY